MADPRPKSRKRSLPDTGRSPARRGTLRLFLMLGVLVVVNLYVFLWRHGTSVPAVRASAASVGKQPTAPAPAPVEQVIPEAASKSAVLSGKVDKNESLGKIL